MGCIEKHRKKTKELKCVFLGIMARAFLFFTSWKYYKIVEREALVHV